MIDNLPLANDLNSSSGLRKDLAKVYAELRAGTIDHKDASELANLAGKMINTAKTQIAYYALRGEIPNITFLHDDSADSA